MTEKKEPKPRKQSVTLVKVPQQYQGLDCYCGIDKSTVDALGGRKGFEASIAVDGRSLSQNALWAVWYAQIGREQGEPPELVKRRCKLNYGVPILCAGEEGFRKIWLAKFDKDNYRQQIYVMKYLPVTSLFSKEQGMEYQETLVSEFAYQDIKLIVL